MKKPKSLSYAASGVNIDEADKAKAQMERTLRTNDTRVLNAVGAFASLFDGRFPGYKRPVLVLKTEEPGSKQLIAFQHDRVESICQDMINHLINDIAVMGATPLAVQDAVICGKLDGKTVTRIVAAISQACRAQGCVLTGGETSEQPGVLAPGTYILTSSVIGIAERSRVIDGSKIRPGDVVLAIASNGLHTNGYSLVRRLMKEQPKLANTVIPSVARDGSSARDRRMTFLDAILKPHTCYFQALRGIFLNSGLHGMAHITGSGVEGNLERVLPKAIDARIDLSAIKILPVFRAIRDAGDVDDDEMMRTYNMGVGLTMVVSKAKAKAIQAYIRSHGHDCYPIGEIAKGKGRVTFSKKLQW